MKRIEVVAAAITKEHNLLVTQRGYGEWRGWWELPGGKMEVGETQQEALLRELKEELAIDAEIHELIDTIDYDYPEFHLTMHVYHCTINNEKPVFHEHMAARWLTADNIDEVKWLPADLALIDNIKDILIH